MKETSRLSLALSRTIFKSFHSCSPSVSKWERMSRRVLSLGQRQDSWPRRLQENKARVQYQSFLLPPPNDLHSATMALPGVKRFCSLSDDVLFITCQYLVPRPSDIRHLSLTCRRVRGACMPILFRTVYRRFVQFLDEPGSDLLSPIIYSYVR